MKIQKLLTILLAFGFFATGQDAIANDAKPMNVVFILADDLGWSDTELYGKTKLYNTPNIMRLADLGCTFNRAYSNSPLCSPTRASVLTGRTHDRTGVVAHGYALHRQERTVAQAMQKSGYATGHFGKWHLNGVRGPGVPVLDSDPHHPCHFGFEHWLTVTNFFDQNPVMSRMGTFEEFQGDSSEVIVGEALKFIKSTADQDKPFFTVIWYGSPHSPWVALEQDQIPGEETRSVHHHGELVAMDRSIGALRNGLKKMGVADNTLVWF